MAATLFGVPASHPALAAELILRHKGIEYRRVDFVAGLHRVLLRALGFPGVTVPALLLDGIHLQGTRRIGLALDALRPEAPLIPREPSLRKAVLRAETWADEILQPVPRRLVPASLRRNRSTLATYLEDARLGIPPSLAARAAAPVVLLQTRLNRADDDAVRRDLVALPRLIDRVDGLLAEGVIGGPERNLADYQIATSVALLMTMDDIRPLIEERPAAAHAREVVVRYPGRVPRTLPAAWVPA